MVNTVKRYLTPYFTADSNRIQFGGPPAHHIHGCYLMFTCGPLVCTLSERHHSRTPRSQVSIRRTSRPALQDRVSGSNPIWYKLTVFYYYISVKSILGIILELCRVRVMCWFLCQTDEINTIFNPVSVIYIWELKWVLVIWSYQQWFCFPLHFKPIKVYDRKTQGFLNVHITYRLRNEFGPCSFHNFISFEFGIYRIFKVKNLKYIHVLFTMLWAF